MKNKTFIHLFFLIFFIYGCEKQNENQPPEIKEIVLDKTSITPGGVLQVTSTVIDADGDNLTYTWNSQDGNLSEPNKPSTLWTISPSFITNKNASIKLTVTDGKLITTEVREIIVREGNTVSGAVYYAGTSIPISGVTITIGSFSTTTTTDGLFSIKHIASGVSNIIATKTGFDTFNRTESISSTNCVFNINLTSSTETKMLYGIVKTVENITLAGIRIVVLNQDGTESGLTDVTDLNGHYQIASVPQGTRLIKFKNENNLNTCKEVSYEVYVANFDKSFDARIKILRNVDLFTDGFESNVSGINAVFYVGHYELENIATFRPIKCVEIPLDAESPYLRIDHYMFCNGILVGVPFYGINCKLYLIPNCTDWSTTNYSYWNDAIMNPTKYSFKLDNFLGKSIRPCFKISAVDYHWTIVALNVDYYW